MKCVTCLISLKGKRMILLWFLLLCLLPARLHAGPVGNPDRNTFSCVHNDNQERGCCCLKGAHTYLFAPRYVENVFVRFDTGRNLNCRSLVKLEVEREGGWETVMTFQAVSSKGKDEYAPVELRVSVGRTIRGFRISDGCVCCIDYSEITLDGAGSPGAPARANGISDVRNFPGRPWVANASGQIFQWVGNEWMPVPGHARDVGVGADGSVWIVSARAVKGGYAIYKWENGGWKRVAGGAVRIDVGPDGRPWIVNAMGQIFQWTGKEWMVMPGRARDIGIGSDGSAWIIGTNPVKGGYDIYRWRKGMWKRRSGGAVRIDVGPDGSPCVVNTSNQIFQRVGKRWVIMPGRARDVGIGSDGTLWIVGTTPVKGGYAIYRWEDGLWKRVPGGAVAVSVNCCGVVRPVPVEDDPTSLPPAELSGDEPSPQSNGAR